MNDDAPNPILVLSLIALAVFMLPFALIGAGIYGLYKLNQKWAAESAEEAAAKKDADALAARPGSSRREVGPTTCGIDLAPDRGEIFTPFATNLGRAYRLRITGTSVLTKRTQTKEDPRIDELVTIDALYIKDHAGNFTKSHFDPKAYPARRDGLFIDGQPLVSVPHEIAFEDRDKHTYEIVLDGTGKKVAFAFHTGAMLYDGRFTIAFSECAESVPTLATRAALEAQRKDAENLAEAVEAMSTLTGLDRNWSDPAFVEAFAQGRSGQILARREELQRRLVELHDNRRLMAHLRDHYPELLARLTGPIDAFVKAQRLAVTPPPAPKLRKKKTPAEVRAYMVRGAEMVAEDERAILEAVLAADERNRQTLRDKNLDEDEIDNILGNRAEVLMEAKERIAARKGLGDVQIVKVG